MTEDDQMKACDALVGWFRSQDIGPTDAIPILAMSLVLACVSRVANTGQHDRAGMNQVVKDVSAASKLVLEQAIKMFDAKAGGANWPAGIRIDSKTGD
jgi:hypothetical protein